MIEYQYEEEKVVALHLADILSDEAAKKILIAGNVLSREEARHLSRFFWAMVNRSAEGVVDLPCDGGSEYWTEKLYNSIGGYLERAGYEDIWNDEIEKA